MLDVHDSKLQVGISVQILDYIWMSACCREELLEESHLEEYSDKLRPWNPEYLKEKDGTFLYNLVKKSDKSNC